MPISLVSIIDSERQWFKSSQGLDVKETHRDISFCGHSILGDELFAIPNALEDERFADNPLVQKAPNIRFYAGCPLKVLNGSKLGTLCIIDRKPREFTEEDLDLLKDLAAMAEQEIAAVQLSTLDELTLISNRRGFISFAEYSLNFCKRNKTNATLLYFDLDGFKEINDNYGHAEGDKALVAFADLMRHIFRSSDVFARLGGDEFVALLSDTDEANITEALARFKQSVSDYNKQENRGYDLQYSVGYSHFSSEENISIEDLLAKADREMYKNKKEKQLA